MDARIQAYLRRAAARGRATERIGPFLATFDSASDNPFLNYAIPDDGARPSAADVQALEEAYAGRGLRPRLEYLPGAAPGVEAALRAAGFAPEGLLPLMTRPSDRVVDPPRPEGVELLTPRTDEELLGATAAQSDAFGGPPLTPAEAERLRTTISSGGIAVAARELATGTIVGAGVCTPPADAVTELAGIGVRAEYRRRGIAGAITARLAEEAFAGGVNTAFLTPGNEGAGRVYERAGFEPTSLMLHISRA
ncbi:MAG: GNAT family N-acetyltransferase [Actinobacteria bacterium]|nr:GNAT family N-acetyltransferase [Actinomycetota bacterium]